MTVEPDSATREPQPPLRIVIADDHPIVRQGLKNELARQAGIQILGEAEDNHEALRLARTLRPDLVLLDIKMPGSKPAQIVRQMCALPHPPRVLILSAYGDTEYVLTMLKAGATGYLLKDEDPAVILQGVRAVGRGEAWLSPKVASLLLNQSIQEKPKGGRAALSPRERDVLLLLARGYDNQRIAQGLCLSEGTVKNHLTRIYDKLGIDSRAEAIAWAWEHGLVTLHSE